MKPSSLFKPKNYLNKLKAIRRSFVVTRLINKPIPEAVLSRIWPLQEEIKASEHLWPNTFNIFGTEISLNEPIHWHKDYVSGFKYLLKRFDKIKLSNWYNKGIDVKFPWEVSRFYFAVNLAQKHIASKEEKYYIIFKRHVSDWLRKNPYCYGVNWYCTMEVAIRAINWIVAINIFGKVFEKDINFKKLLSKSLVQHAEYISTFPEIKEDGHTNNHATADYTGLLFLALTLKQHPLAKKWLKQSVEGIEHCIRYQTYEDGVNFEGSIPYHRLVLEMFAYSAIVSKANNVRLSKKYYELLFKMFEYSAAYMDHDGNAPQVGDNDSGRLLILQESDEHDHSYLLDLGEHIFDYRFKSQCKKRNTGLRQWLPFVEKTNLESLKIRTRQTDESIAFEKGGAYFLKNENFSLMVACFPLGQKGKGGHNHYDTGSFTLSVIGYPVIIDTGSYTYTRNYQQRNLFRQYHSHNVVFKNKDEGFYFENIFSLKKGFEVIDVVVKETKIICFIKNQICNYEFMRIFEIEDEYSLKITDKCDDAFYIDYNINPLFKEINSDKNTIHLKNEIFYMTIENGCYKKKTFYYSHNYNVKTVGTKITQRAINNNTININVKISK